MAFYPDELSPIERIRHLGNPSDLSEVSQAKNRRQWKSLVLGKKEVGMNSFATIAEEKEDEISSDGSNGRRNETVAGELLTNKKITFPKPRKYINSRTADRKDGLSLKSLEVSPKEFLGGPEEMKSFRMDEPSNTTVTPAAGPAEPNDKKQENSLQEMAKDDVPRESPIESRWKEIVRNPVVFTAWRKARSESEINFKTCSNTSTKQEESRNKTSGNMKPTKTIQANKQEVNSRKRKEISTKKGAGTSLRSTQGEKPLTGKSMKSPIKGKQKAEKSKTLNMKDVVNVYKNLAYGSKDEIKSFVENLSFVKDQPNLENNKDLRSVMNLKALENKIKKFTRKTAKSQGGSTLRTDWGPKVAKQTKKVRKARTERLARHKVVKVPAAGVQPEKVPERRYSKRETEDKEPWKYVGMESALGKSYFVYPAYPPLKKEPRKKKIIKPKTVGAPKEKKEDMESTTVKKDQKVKACEVVIRGGLLAEGARAGALRSRPSATTACPVEFRQAPEAEGRRGTGPSLLFYLHGTKALNVRSPYSDKQFSRVKFLRKDGRGAPLIKGHRPRPRSAGYRSRSIGNVTLPNNLSKASCLDMLDFEEDIQNITDFLRSQNRSSQEVSQGRNILGKERRSSPELGFLRHLERRRVAGARHQLQRHRHRRHPHPPVDFEEDDRRHHHHHQHRRGAEEQSPLSPSAIIEEISKNIHHLQYLPDTEENRRIICNFFDELDHRIEATRLEHLSRRKWTPFPDCFGSFPILGY